MSVREAPARRLSGCRGPVDPVTAGGALTYTGAMTRPFSPVPATGIACLGAVLLAAFALSGCGQTGALYLPGDAPAATPVADGNADGNADDEGDAGDDESPATDDSP